MLRRSDREGGWTNGTLMLEEWQMPLINADLTTQESVK